VDDATLALDLLGILVAPEATDINRHHKQTHRVNQGLRLMHSSRRYCRR
jgi:hypothetical protein